MGQREMEQVFLAENPEAVVTKSHFGVRKVPIPAADNQGGYDAQKLNEGEILVKLDCMSVDPYMRSRMSGDGPGYMSAWKSGDTVESHCVGTVVASRCGKYPNGTKVLGMMPWQNSAVLDGNKAFPSGPMEIPNMEGLAGKHSLFLGIFGVTGLTAAIGMKVKGKLSSGGVLVVSGAAGATGSVAGQIGKILGAKKVIGICGTDEKCNFIKEIGFTHSINYKIESIKEKLAEYCENEVTCYFDNVGGETSELVIANMRPDSNIVLCGQISSYNDRSIPYPNPLSDAIQKHVTENRISRDRFLLLEWMQHYEGCLQELLAWYAEGKVKSRETFVQGLSQAGEAFCQTMGGKNIGKMVVVV